jgi:hypothetical protein
LKTVSTTHQDELKRCNKAKRDSLIGDFTLYNEMRGLDYCFFDHKLLPAYQECYSDDLVPDLKCVKQFLVRRYHDAFAKLEYKNTFMYAGPSVNIAKGWIERKDGSGKFPAKRLTAEQAFTQRFVDFNIDHRGQEYSMILPVDIDETGKLEAFIEFLVEYELPAPLIIKNRTSGRFQAHFVFKEFQTWEDLWRIRAKFNEVLTSKGFKVDCSEYRNTRNAFFDPNVIDPETGEVVYQDDYTNAKDRSKNFKDISWQAHNAEIMLFYAFDFVELKDFAPLFAVYVPTVEDINPTDYERTENEKAENEKIGIGEREGSARQVTDICRPPKTRSNRRMGTGGARVVRNTIEDYFYCGKKEQWLEYTKQHFSIDGYWHPTFKYLIDHPSTVQEGSRHFHMVMVVKSACSKDLNLTLNDRKNWGVLPSGYKESTLPKVIMAVRAQLPGHDEKTIKYQANYILDNTIVYMVENWDEEKAGNGGKKYWSANRWNEAKMFHELNTEYMKRTGTSNRRFYELKKVGRISSQHEKKHGRVMLHTLSSIKIVVNQEELDKKDEEKCRLISFLVKEHIKYHSGSDTDTFHFEDMIIKEVEIPPPIPPPREIKSYSTKELVVLWDC